MENVHHSFPESNVTSSNASAQAGGCCDRTPLVHTERRLTTVNPWRCREKVLTAADDRQDGHLQYLKHDVSSATCGIKHHKASNIFYFFFSFAVLTESVAAEVVVVSSIIWIILFFLLQEENLIHLF